MLSPFVDGSIYLKVEYFGFLSMVFGSNVYDAHF